MATLQLLVSLPLPNSQNCWSLALEIPTADLGRFCLFPLKWVRYLAYTLLGCQGHLSKSTHGDPVDYNFSPINHKEMKGRYYYITTGPLLPLDLQALDDRFSDSGVSTQSSQAGFRNAIVERDEKCIVTGYNAKYSMACHIIPRSKGDDYIERFSALRTNGRLVMDDICDCRNGFLMEPLSHNLFDSGEFALLPTPNFALLTEDIPLAVDLAATPTACLILQWFKLDLPGNPVLHDRPHGKIISEPADPSKLEQWPPPFLLDAAYGAAAFSQWSTSNFKDEFMTLAYSHYYDEDRDDNADEEGGGGLKNREKQMRVDKTKARAERAVRRSKRDDAISIVALLWELSARRHDVATGEVPVRDTDKDKSFEKVSTWLETSTH